MATRLQGLKRFFTHNAELKVLAIILATLSFYAIRNVTSYEKAYTLPVTVRPPDPPSYGRRRRLTIREM